MSRRRKRLIEREDLEARPFPGAFAPTAFQANQDPVNRFAASTPPQGVRNPLGAPNRAAYGAYSAYTRNPEELR